MGSGCVDETHQSQIDLPSWAGHWALCLYTRQKFAAAALIWCPIALFRGAFLCSPLLHGLNRGHGVLVRWQERVNVDRIQGRLRFLEITSLGVNTHTLSIFYYYYCDYYLLDNQKMSEESSLKFVVFVFVGWIDFSQIRSILPSSRGEGSNLRRLIVLVLVDRVFPQVVRFRGELGRHFINQIFDSFSY